MPAMPPTVAGLAAAIAAAGAAALAVFKAAAKAAKKLFKSDKPAKRPVSKCPNAGPTKLGAGVNKLIKKSPTLEKNIKALEADGWVIKYGEKGKGSFADRTKKEIVVDSNEKGDPKAVAQTLAHESGHALYTPDAYVPPDGLSKEDYVKQNVQSNLKDEGEATLMNAQVRDEISKNGGPDIGIAGTKSADYQKAYEQYQKDGDREKARKAIGDVFAKGEEPSTMPGKTYEDYYAKPYADFYDENVKKP